MAPVAHKDPDPTPIDEPARVLKDAVNAKYNNLMDFIRDVADASGNTPASEKGTFYRYVRGGSAPDERLAIYGRLLNINPATISRPRERAAPSTTTARIDRRLAALEADMREAVGLMREALELLRGSQRRAGGGAQARRRAT